MKLSVKHLTRREEEVMERFWTDGPQFVHDVIRGLKGPKPHYNTISTIVRGLEEKGYVGHEQFGTTYRYHAVISREDYSRMSLQFVVDKYFNQSYASVLSMFVREDKLSEQEEQELVAMVEARRKDKNNER